MLELVRILTGGRGGHEFEVVGLLDLKGLPQPLAACIVRWSRHATAGAASSPFPPELAAMGGGPFVGRGEELHNAIDTAMATERARSLWLLGEPGIGKTRLAVEIARRGHVAGGLVLHGRCDEHVATPFQPLIQALRWYAGTVVDDQLIATVGVDPAALARLVPELRERMPGLQAQIAPATEIEQYRLFEAVRSWLGALSETHTVVFLVDDAHWADRPTLDLLAHVLRSAEPARLLVVATARDTAPDASHRLSELIDDLGATGRSQCVRLGGLTGTEVAALVTAARPNAPEDADLAARLAAETAGNPLFLEAVLAELAQDGAGGRRQGPGNVQAAVRRRVRGLDQTTQELLQVAALVGLEFPLAVIADAAGVDEQQALTRIEHGVGAGLVDELSVDRFRFTHGLVRDALAGEISASRRARLHMAVAGSIEQRWALSLDDHLRALAHHYASAGDDPAVVTRALDYARRSAQRALDMLAFDAATEDFAMATELTARLPGVPASDLFQLLMAKGQSERVAAAHAAALETLRAAAALARSEQDWTGLAQAAIAFEEASWRPGLLAEDAHSLLGEAVGHADDLAPETVLIARTSAARALHYAGRRNQARTAAEATVVEARASGRPVALAHALGASVQTRVPMLPGDLPIVIERAEEVWSLLEGLTDLDPAATIAEYACVACSLRADREEMVRWIGQLTDVTHRLGSRFARFVLLSMLQIQAFLDGDLDRAEVNAGSNLEFGRQLGEDVSGVHATQMFLIRREQDRLRELVPAVQALLTVNATSAMWAPGLVLLLADSGMTVEAGRLLDEMAADAFSSLAPDDLYPAATCFLAEAAVLLGAADAGGQLAERLRPWQGMGVSLGHLVGHLGSVDRYLGLLARLAGDLTRADRLLANALTFNRQLGAVIWVAHTLTDQAELRALSGDGAGMHPLATEARLLAERHHLGAVNRRLDALPAFDRLVTDLRQTERRDGPTVGDDALPT
ncbi:MAG: AAA family ATPase [Acidimicrobiales bacterium]